MKEQLIQYVELLFAGAQNCDDIKQEILQNTLDRYDDLIATGRVPEAAYRLAIAGIGDINEILGTQIPHTVPSSSAAEVSDSDTPQKKVLRAVAVGLYILSIIPLIVLSGLGMDTIGLCGTLAMVAVATVLILLGAKKDIPEKRRKEDTPSELSKSLSGVIWAAGLGVYFLLSFSTGAWHLTWTIFPVLVALDSLGGAILRSREQAGSIEIAEYNQTMRKNIDKIIWAVGTVIYFIFSFATGAWYISWLIFLITGAVHGLTLAIIDLKEAVKHEA